MELRITRPPGTNRGWTLPGRAALWDHALLEACGKVFQQEDGHVRSERQSGPEPDVGVIENASLHQAGARQAPPDQQSLQSSVHPLGPLHHAFQTSPGSIQGQHRHSVKKGEAAHRVVAVARTRVSIAARSPGPGGAGGGGADSERTRTKSERSLPSRSSCKVPQRLLAMSESARRTCLRNVSWLANPRFSISGISHRASSKARANPSWKGKYSSLRMAMARGTAANTG